MSSFKPYAPIRLSDGIWVVRRSKISSFVVYCHTDFELVTRKVVDWAMVISLKKGCHAVGGNYTLAGPLKPSNVNNVTHLEFPFSKMLLDEPTHMKQLQSPEMFSKYKNIKMKTFNSTKLHETLAWDEKI